MTSEIMDSEQPSAQDNDSDITDMSRRNFLKAAATGALVEAVINPEIALAEDVPQNGATFSDYLRTRTEAIDFKQEVLPMTREVSNLILATAEAQKDMNVSEYGANDLEGEQWTEEGYTPKMSKIYDQLKTIIPNLPEFNRENYNKAIFTDLPKIMARYGVYAQSQFIVGGDEKFNVAYNLISYYQAKPLPDATFETPDGPKQARVTELSPLIIDGHEIKNSFEDKSNGQCEHGNILLFKKSIDKDVASLQQSKEENRAGLEEDGQTKLENRISLVAKTKTGDGQMIAAMDLAAFVSEYYIKDPREESLDSIEAHEAGHLFLSGEDVLQDESFRQITNFPDFMRAQNNNGIKRELLGMLGELMYTKSKNSSLKRILNWGTSDKTEFNYKAGSQWLMQEMVTKIAASPDTYGVKITGKLLDPAYEIILQLPDIGKDRPELITDLTQKIAADRAKIAAINIPNPSLEATISDRTDSNIPGRLMMGAAGVGTMALILGGGYYALKKYSERREAIRIEEEEKKKKRHTKKKKKKK